MATQRVIIVLAAGRGSRFVAASHKLAAPFGEEGVLARTLRHAIASNMPVVVVTTEPFADLARSSIAARDVVVLPEVGVAGDHPTKALGMGRSISAGVQARPHADGWLVLPGDMPLVRPATMQAVARELDRHSVVYAQHGGRRGHPVGFGAELFSELIELSGDQGARRLVARYPAIGLEVDDPGILIDIDTVDDLDAALRDAANPGPPPEEASRFRR